MERQHRRDILRGQVAPRRRDDASSFKRGSSSFDRDRGHSCRSCSSAIGRWPFSVLVFFFRAPTEGRIQHLPASVACLPFGNRTFSSPGRRTTVLYDHRSQVTCVPTLLTVSLTVAVIFLVCCGRRLRLPISFQKFTRCTAEMTLQ